MNTLSRFKINHSIRMCLDMYSRLLKIKDIYKSVYISDSTYAEDCLGFYRVPPSKYDLKDSVWFKINQCIIYIDGQVMRKSFETDYVFGPKSIRYGLLPLIDFKEPYKIIDCKPHE
ncbi:hypothetical protein FDH01_gp241 [Acinetobacter phage vB_AbaM_ME3]|uniref:Uncharacterized protein n=1 Tax=Acinetobacter phage vB_AbaM_ME3 TaxID=1837876 RepID=A0A172Q0J6_9CAUD|nr:hypothetical protein FDH01_gp241 [Acinetobacter phage vB_AbaM_ME3]AND75381.1 hypothetical protein ME3_220 [Acinetobacter phage vB_AbaM_ME3]